ncbi:unnamed protein product [Urochloa humidicola]
MPLQRHNQHTGCFPRDGDLGTVMASLTSDLSAPVQVKGDYLRAGEYYSRAILADPDDSELMSKYGKLVWNVHCYEERSSSYFEQAVRLYPSPLSAFLSPA